MIMFLLKPPHSGTLPVSPNATVIVLGVDTGSESLHGNNRGVVLFTRIGVPL